MDLSFGFVIKDSINKTLMITNKNPPFLICMLNNIIYPNEQFYIINNTNKIIYMLL